MGLLSDVSSQSDLDRPQQVRILVAPAGIKDIQWDEIAPKQLYTNAGFVEEKVGIAPERTQLLGHYTQAQWK
eukprot:9868999-Ditylum_brightwellii.AAC.1